MAAESNASIFFLAGRLGACGFAAAARGFGARVFGAASADSTGGLGGVVRFLRVSDGMDSFFFDVIS
jgi:hypothetical protein